MKITSKGWIAVLALAPLSEAACNGRLVVDHGEAAANDAGGASGGPAAGGEAGAAGSGGPETGGAVGVGGSGNVAGETGGSSGTGGFVSTGGYQATGGYGADSGLKPPTTPAGSSLCGGVQCTASQDCCVLTAKCFDKTDRNACPTPPADGDPQMRTTCGSNTDCAAGEFCQLSGELCAGTGHCVSRTNCGGSGEQDYCGCDGRTYANVQSACLAGVSAPTMGACGTPVQLGGGGAANSPTATITPCGSDAQCSNGEKCCPITGWCYDTSRPALCTMPPAGTTRSCYTSADCYPGSEYCAGAGCDVPGGCRSLGDTSCSPILDAVCGCDGKNYVNADCAASAGIRVASKGECKDGAAP
ncbi:MAG TPA: hypothetical protein VH142_07240 [Polyangiaceae bacterium]|jgi:hypothetical protein|nr:hypothetical protein [Polyangiaceae bacterium]